MKQAGRREWIALAVIALPCLIYAMDLTVLNLALPALSEDLKPSGAQLLWIVDIYGFLVAGSLITMGTLGDRIGRRKLLMIGAAAFAVASVMAAFARSANLLIATRAILGIAGATFAPSTLSLIRNMFPDARQRSTAIGWWMTSYSAGGAIGPLLGGAILARFHWGAVFLLGLPVMALLLAVGPFLLPEYRDPAAGRMDLLSAAGSLLAVLGVIYGIKSLAQDGWGWPAAAALAGGLLSGLALARRQSRLADPLIDLKLFRAPGFSISLAAYMIATVVVFGLFVFVSQYLQLVLGLSPFRAGLWTLPSMLGFVFGSILSPILARRIRPARLIAGGAVMAAIGFALVTQAGGRLGPSILLVALALYSVGLAPAFTLSTDLMVSAAPPERAGSAAAISETSSELGGALGIALLGSLGLAFYHRLMAAAPLDELPSGMATAARDTLGGAAAVAVRLGDPLRTGLLMASQEAFTRVLHYTAAVSATLSLVLGMAVLRFLRPAKP